MADTVDRTVPKEAWGHDHWNLLLYVETRCVDYGGVLDHQHMRASSTANPDHVVYSATGTLMDGAKYPTRLRPGLPDVTGHDDWSCLEDLETAGMVEIILWTTGLVRLTPYGAEIAAKLRQHMAREHRARTFRCPW